MMTNLNKVVKVALVALTMMVGAQGASADEVTMVQNVENTKAPFGFATRSSRTDASAVYNITGGGAYTVDAIKALIESGGNLKNTPMTVDGKKIIVLTSDGATDMGSTILSAITNNDIIVFDGSVNTDFLVDEQITLNGLSNKTLIGFNGARLCTTWHLTDVIKSWLNAVETSSGSGVSNASTASGTGGSFIKYDANGDTVKVNGVPQYYVIDEEGEYLTRKTLVEKGWESKKKQKAYDEDPENNPAPTSQDRQNIKFLLTEYYKKSGIFYIQGCENLIIRNLCFVGPGSVDVGGVDLVSVINTTTHAWVDHCEFIDGQDGNLDITNESDFITVSWCHFHYTDRSYVHQNTNLVGSSDSKTEDRGKLNITFADNEWGENCRSRMPMGRYGKIHLLNNWYNCAGNTEYAVNPRLESEFLVQGNYFDTGVTKTFRNQNATSVTILDNTVADLSATTLSGAGSTVTVPYDYEAMPSAKITDMIDLLVGPKLDIMPTYTENPDNSDDPENPLYSLEVTTTKAAKGLTFSVWAENTMTYQWYKATAADLSDAAEISGATRNSYTFKSGEESTIYLYCVATGLAGSVASNTIKVVVSGTGEPIFITDLRNYTIPYQAPKGVPYTLSVDAGETPTYQWYHNTVASTEGATAIDGATSKSYTYTTPSGSAADRRDFYYCIATNTVEGKTFNVSSKIACVKYVAMQKPINFVATTIEPGTTGGGDMSGLALTGKVDKNNAQTVNGTKYYSLRCNSSLVSSGSAANYVTVTPEGGFKVGDKLVLAGYVKADGYSDDPRGGDYLKKWAKIQVLDNATDKNEILLTDTVINVQYHSALEPVDFEYEFTSAYPSVILGRNGGTTMYINKIVVTRGDPEEPNMPYITTDIDETYETTEGTAVDIAMVAEDADSYEWYTVSGTGSYETGKAQITGQTTATCSFSEATAGTYYVYGVAISGTGDVHKYDTTRIATVTVKKGSGTKKVKYTWDMAETWWQGMTQNGANGSEQHFKARLVDGTYDTEHMLYYYGDLDTTNGAVGSEDHDFTSFSGSKWIRTGGGALLTSGSERRVFKYHAKGAGTIKVYALGVNNNKDGNRKLYINNALTTEGAPEPTPTGDGSSASYVVASYDIAGESDIYIWHAGGGAKYFGIVAEIEEASDTESGNAVIKYPTSQIKASGAGVSTPDELMDEISVSLNGNLGWKDSFSWNTITYAGIASSGSWTDADSIKFVMTPQPGVTFTPSKISLGACRNATDNGALVVKANGVILTPTESVAEEGYTVPGRNKSGDYTKDGYRFNYNLSTGAITPEKPLTISMYMAAGPNGSSYSTKTWGLDSISIEGTYEKSLATAVSKPKVAQGDWNESSEKWAYTITCPASARINYQIGTASEVTNQTTPQEILVAPNETFRVWASDPTERLDNSEDVEDKGAKMPAVKKPTITIGALTMASSTFSVTMASADGGTIHYTTDGTEPTEASSTYSSAIDVAPSSTIKAIVVKTHYANSDVESVTTLAFSHPTGDEAIVMDNGASGENKGISYTVAGDYNAGTYSGNSGTGIKYQTGKVVGPTGGNTGFRIYVNDGFIIKKLVFTNFSSNNASTETFDHVYVDASTTDIRDVNGEEYESFVVPYYGATSGDKSMEWTLDNLNARDSVVFHVTKGYGQVRALVQVYYEIDDSPVSLSIGGGDAIAVNATNFPENIYTNSTVYEEVPMLRLTTSKGFVYDFAYTGTDEESKKSKYAYTLNGTTYEVWIKVKAVAAPIINIAEDFGLVKPDADHITASATVNGGYKVTLTDIKDGATPYIILDTDIDSENARDYKAVAQRYYPAKEYYALKNVYAFCSYEDEDTHANDSTSVRKLTCPDNTYDKTKPFAVFIYQQGYGDTGTGQENAENAASYDPTKDQVHLGLADQYNVIDFKITSAQSDKSIVEVKPDITNAKLVVLSEMIGGSGQWIDAEGTNTGSTHMAMSFRDDLIGATNVLNMKMFFYSQSKNNSSRWAWAQPATLTNSVVSVKPTNAMYKVFEEVSFSRDGSIQLFNGIDEEGTLNHLQLVHNYNEANENLPEFTTLATATDVLDDEEYDALHFFEKNGYTYVATGISINDYLKYDENLRYLVSTIGSMINSGTSLGTRLEDLPAPRIRDNGDGSATITNNNVAAKTYYKTSANDNETWDAATIKAADLTTTDFLTPKFASDVYVYAISDVSGTASAVSKAFVKGTTRRYIYRTTDDTEAVGVEAAMPFTAEAGSITIPYNQSFSKPGYTVTSWKDKYTGTEYTPGTSFATTTASQDLYLVAQWTKNTKKITDVGNDETDDERTVTWNFLQSDGAPALALEYGSTTLGKQAILVGQLKFHDGTFIDVPMTIDVDHTVTLPDNGEEYTGKFNNKQNSYTDATQYITEFAQVRNGTKFTFPAVYGMTVNYKQATFEKYERDATTKALLPTVHEKSVTYVSQSQLADGTLTNPGLVLTDGKATNGSGTATVSDTYGAGNLLNGGNFSYAGVDTLATLTSNESAYYIAPEAPNTTTFTEGALNYGTAFMHSLSVTYPKLYDLTTVVNMPNDHVYLLQEELTEEQIKARAVKVTLSESKKNTAGRYGLGETVNIDVVPGYSFYFNEGDVEISNATHSFTKEEKKLVSGTFTLTGAPTVTISLNQDDVYAYNVSYTPSDAGSVRINSLTDKDEAHEYTAFPADSTITITPTPKVGYQFEKWTNDEGVEWVASSPGENQASFPDGVTQGANGVLTIVVSEGNSKDKYYKAVFVPGKEGTTYYELPSAGLYKSDTSYEPFGETLAPGTVTDNTYTNYKFPSQYTTTALYIPTNYTLYKPGYTLKNWVYIPDFDPEDPKEYYETKEEYQIGDYHYFANKGDEKHIIPIFRENQANFDYRTTTADITWDFRTAYYAQHLNFPTTTEFDYATHATINGGTVIDVPLHIKGIADNTTLDEWCHFDEGTVITVPSGLGATFTLAAYYKLSSTTIDGVVPLEYTVRNENYIPVYYYTYTTQNPATSIDIVIGKDHTYYKYIRAQLPAADKVTLTTKANNDAWGGIELQKANTTSELIADAEAASDVTYTTAAADEGTVYTMALGSYVKIKATRERLYELKSFVIDGDTIPATVAGAAAKGYTVTVPSGTDKEYTLTFRLFSYATTVEAVYGNRTKYQVTYSSGGQAYGEAPGVQVKEEGETFTMPSTNHTLYLEGYTLKYWMDESGTVAVDKDGVSTGENKYEWGKEYTMSQDLYLNPVFEINDFTLFDIEGSPTVEWPLATGDDPVYGGAPLLKYQKSSGVYVAQLKQTTGQFKDMFIDLPLNIDCTESSAKVDNSASTIRCQVNTGSKMSVPTNSNTKITIYTVNGELSSTKIAGSTSYTPQLDPGTTRDYYATVSYTGNESSQNIEFNGDAGYFKMVKAQYGKVDNSGLPVLDYVTVNNIALGAYGTSLESYSLADLVENKTIKIPVTLSTTALTMPKVKAEADQSDAIVTVNQATVADTTATIIVKTSTGAPVGIYKIVFDPSYESVAAATMRKVEMNGMLVQARDVNEDLQDYLEEGTKMSVNGAINITFSHEMMPTDTINTSVGKVVANGGKTLTFRYWNLAVNTTYTFVIEAGTLSDVYGNSFDDEIRFEFTTAATTQVIVKRNVNFVVTHKQTHSFNTADPTQNYTSTAKRQVASDELIANLDAAGIAYGTIDEGIALANANSGTDRYYIFVPNGEYQIKGNRATDAISTAGNGAAPADNSGKVRDELLTKKIYNGVTAITHDNISITGQSETDTKLFNKPEIEGISYTSTFFVNGTSGFYVQDMTLTNKFDYKTSILAQGSGTAQAARAVVLRDRGNKTIMKNVTMDSWQDTYYSNLSNKNNDSRGYFEDCTIMGYVDFFCGDGDQWFQNCKLVLRNGKSGNASNMVAPATDAVQQWGYVFKDCEILAEDDVTYATCNGKFTLGRPWKNSPAMSLIGTKFNVLSSSDGYKQMSNSGLVLRMHEYGSLDGNGALLDLGDRSLRASSPGAGSYSAVMTPAEAAEYTVHNALGGTDGYDPTLYTKQISMEDANLTTLDRSLTWTAKDEALCYFIFRKNAQGEYELYAITAENSYELDDNQIGNIFIVRAANQRGGLGEPSNELTYNVHESYQLTLVESQKAPIVVGTNNVGMDVTEVWSWSTIYLDYNAKAPTVSDEDKNAKAYVYAVVDVTSTSMTLKRVNILEKNQGYIVKGDVGTYTFAYTDSDGEYYDGSKEVTASKAASEDRLSILDGTVETIDRAGMNVYTLYYKQNYGLGFYNYTGDYLNAYRAYLNGSYVDGDGTGSIVIEGGSSGDGRGFIFLDDFAPTNIGNVNGNANTNADDSEKIFTVYGQRVKRSEMIKGRVYIVNGRKIAY